MAEMVPHFCVFHINAPGQHYGAEVLPDAYGYPNMDDLAEQVSQNHSFIDLQGCQVKKVKIAKFNYLAT